MRAVVLVGTSHKFMYFRGGAEDVVLKEFIDYLKDLCKAHSIQAIGEEASLEEVHNRKTEKSIAKSLADEIAIRHGYCDMNNAERAINGVIHMNTIKAQGWLSNSSEEQIAAEVRASHAIREREWLKRIIELDIWPVLFVCGAEHVPHIKKLILDNRIKAAIACNDWEPQKKSPA